MGERERLRRPVGVLDQTLHRYAGSQSLEPDQAQAIVLADLVVVSRVSERERQQPLLFQVGFVDSREASRDDGGAAQQPGRQRGVLAAAALAVVVIADDDPLD